MSADQMSVGQICHKSLFAKSLFAECLFAKCLLAKCLLGNSMFAKYIVQISVGRMSVKCVFAKSLSSIYHFAKCQPISFIQMSVGQMPFEQVSWNLTFPFLFSNKFWNKKKIVQCFCCRDTQHFFIFGRENLYFAEPSKTI
jgi:hypothetical protein